MNFNISKNHPLHHYHRNRPNFAGKTDEQVLSQWGRMDVLEGVPDRGFIAGSYESITLQFTCGSMGLDESGSLCLNFRTICDIGTLQWTHPEREGYVSVATDGDAQLVLSNRGGVTRPFHKGLWVNITDASLKQGNSIVITLGERSGGSPGWRQQTFQELPFPVRVSVDPFGTGLFHELPQDIGWNILPGKLDRYILCAPSHGLVGESFALKVKGMDRWGNPLRDTSQHNPEIFYLNQEIESPVKSEGTHEKGVGSILVHLPNRGYIGLRFTGERVIPTAL